ncbi:MAG: rod shape-determining protein RodA [Patescibacteria group bacterium]
MEEGYILFYSYIRYSIRIFAITSMYSLLEHLKKFDWLLMGAVLLLMMLGLISLFSLVGVSQLSFFYRQIIWAILGLLMLIGVSFVDFRIFRVQSVAIFVFYLLTILLLVILLVAQFKVRGVESWINLGLFSFQPVELIKITLVVLLAKFFSKRHIEIYRIEHLVVSGIYVAIPTLLVLLQPDLGSSIVLMAIWVSVVLFSGMKLRHFILLIILFSVFSYGVWHVGLEPYQKARITTFLNPYADPKGAGYQMIQSMIAVGSGRVWGKGLGYGSQSHLNFLPEAEADFIFAAFAEEWGFIGTIAMIGVLSIVLWRIVSIGARSADNFSRLYTLGFAASIFTQGFIHIGANMGVLPITGITLPFASYGGSSLVTLLIGVGIVQNINMNARRAIAGEL